MSQLAPALPAKLVTKNNNTNKGEKTMEKITVKELIAKLAQNNEISFLDDCVCISLYAGFRKDERLISKNYMTSTIGAYLEDLPVKNYYFSMHPMMDDLSVDIDIVIDRQDLA